MLSAPTELAGGKYTDWLPNFEVELGTGGYVYGVGECDTCAVGLYNILAKFIPIALVTN